MPQPFCLASLFSVVFITGDPDMRALIVVCRYLGDVLLATPLAQSLKHAGYAVDWLVAPGTETMLEQQAFADHVQIVDPSKSWFEQLKTASRLLRKYDSAFVLTASDRPVALALGASAHVYGLIPSEGWQHAWKRRFCCRWIPYETGCHMASYAIKLGEIAGLDPCRNVQITWSEADHEILNTHLPWRTQTPYIHLHPFARWPYKWWNHEDWKKIIEYLLDEGFCIAITGSPVEANAAYRLAENYAPEAVHVLAGTLNWRQMSCLSAHARAYVGLDTANTHLAASTGAPVIALFGPTDPRIWGPWPNGFDGQTPWQASSENGVQRAGNISLLQGTQDCVPCQLEGCDRQPDSDSACLQTIPARQVWREVRRRLEETALKPSPCDGQSSASGADG